MVQSAFLEKVLIPGGPGARDDGHTLHDGGHRHLAVHLPDALLLQLRDGLLPLALHVAERVGGVDVGDQQRESVYFVIRYQHLGQDPDPGVEPLARLGLEIACNAGIVRTPDHGPGLRRGDSVVAALLYELEVAVSRAVELDLGDLGADPHREREGALEHLLHAELQLPQGDMPFVGCHPRRIPRVRRAPKSMMLRAVSPRQTFSASPWSMRPQTRPQASAATVVSHPHVPVRT